MAAPWAGTLKSSGKGESLECQQEGTLILRRVAWIKGTPHHQVWVECPSTGVPLLLCQRGALVCENLDVPLTTPVTLTLRESPIDNDECGAEAEVHFFGELEIEQDDDDSEEDDCDCGDASCAGHHSMSDVPPELIELLQAGQGQAMASTSSSDEGSSAESDSEDDEGAEDQNPGVTIEEIEEPVSASALEDKENSKKSQKEVSTEKSAEAVVQAKKPAKEDLRVKKTAGKEEQQAKKQQQQQKQQQKQEAPEGALKPGVKRRLPSGLSYELMKVGNNKKIAHKGKKVQVHYKGTLAKNGKQFDKGELKLTVGAQEVVPGFDKGIEGMMLGEQRRIFIPAKLGYGSARTGPIPPNSNLVFDVTMTRIDN